MAMAAILFNGVEPFKQTVNILSKKGPMWNLVKTRTVFSEENYVPHQFEQTYRWKRLYL